MDIKKTIEFDEGIFDVYDNLIVSTLNPGVNEDTSVFNIINHLSSFFFSDKPWGYVSNRRHRNAIDPLIYLKLNSNNTKRRLIAYGIVSYHELTSASVEYEKQFLLEVNVKTFSNINSALSWVSEKVTDEEEKRWAQRITPNKNGLPA